jgi:putative hydrolase of HD superfamily
MTAQDTKKEILASDEFVMEELRRLQRLFELKAEIRYGEERTDITNPESVAEHVFGMHALFSYFWPLEDPELRWDEAKMRTMITFHDIEEIITGDLIGYLKTAEDKAVGEEAMGKILKEIPSSLSRSITDLLHEYEARESKEAQFVKAIDKIEPVVHLCNPKGKELLHRMGTTITQHHSIKLPYFEPFSVIRRFYDVVISNMEKDGFFVPEA